MLFLAIVQRPRPSSTKSTKLARDDQIVRPGHGGSHSADPTDAANEPQEGR
jgi:hypothetical protein